MMKFDRIPPALCGTHDAKASQTAIFGFVQLRSLNRARRSAQDTQDRCCITHVGATANLTAKPRVRVTLVNGKCLPTLSTGLVYSALGREAIRGQSSALQAAKPLFSSIGKNSLADAALLTGKGDRWLLQNRADQRSALWMFAPVAIPAQHLNIGSDKAQVRICGVRFDVMSLKKLLRKALFAVSHLKDGASREPDCRRSSVTLSQLTSPGERPWQ